MIRTSGRRNPENSGTNPDVLRRRLGRILAGVAGAARAGQERGGRLNLASGWVRVRESVCEREGECV